MNLYLNKILKKFEKNKSNSLERIIYFYRYSSWFLTSLVYLTNMPYNVIFYKLGVILSLLILSRLVNNLYIKYSDNTSILKKLVLIETIGIEFVLLPTGGLSSPFIWYALNPILVSASYLSSYFSWINLIYYLVTGSIVSYIMFNTRQLSLLQIILNNSDLIIVFILINLVIQLLSKLSKEQQQFNIEKEKSMEQIMSLYQITEALNNHSNKENLFEALSAYTAKLTKSNLCLFWLIGKDTINTNKKLSILEITSIIKALKELNCNDHKDKKTYDISLLNLNFLAIPILSPSTFYGIAAIQKKENMNYVEANQNIKLLQFIAQLSAVTLERFNLEGVEDYLLVMEEQNRIANEIHDSVSQRLFSISYGIYGVLNRIDNLPREEIADYLQEMRESSNLAMQELRKSIYKLSSKKNGEKYLQYTIKAYLDSISKLQDIKTQFEVNGDENLMAFELKKGLTRIIRESCGNAIHHGKCKTFKVHLSINIDYINVIIEDDGNGFILKETENKEGLGLSNMIRLVNSFDGSINFISDVGLGTTITILIPAKKYIKMHEGSIAI